MLAGMADPEIYEYMKSLTVFVQGQGGKFKRVYCKNGKKYDLINLTNAPFIAAKNGFKPNVNMLQIPVHFVLECCQKAFKF